MNPVKLSTERGVLTAILADVENRNALGGALVEGLLEAVTAANADPEIRALVVTNEGSTFCAGANLKERSADRRRASGSGGFEELLAAWLHRGPARRGPGHHLGGVPKMRPGEAMEAFLARRKPAWAEDEE